MFDFLQSLMGGMGGMGGMGNNVQSQIPSNMQVLSLGQDPTELANFLNVNPTQLNQFVNPDPYRQMLISQALSATGGPSNKNNQPPQVGQPLPTPPLPTNVGQPSQIQSSLPTRFSMAQPNLPLRRQIIGRQILG